MLLVNTFILHEPKKMTETVSGIPFDTALLETSINEPAVNRTVREICHKASNLEGTNKLAWLLKAISFIDLTSLNGNDTPTTIDALCQKATHALPTSFTEADTEKTGEIVKHTAAICVYPSRIQDAVTALNNYDPEHKISIASVAGGFPSGQFPLETRVREIELAIKSGAQEIDIVIDRSLAMRHAWKELYEEIKICRKTCGSKIHLKTILAIGELPDLDTIYKASMVAMMAGSDFIKTSTGKEAVNATLPAGVVMCRAIKDYYRHTGGKVGFKPAGGIKTAKDALEWMVLVETELGNHYLCKDLFRIGASSLLNNIQTAVESELQVLS